MKISKDLVAFVDELNDGLLDKVTGAYIRRHYGSELEMLLRQLGAAKEGPTDLVELFGS